MQSGLGGSHDRGLLAPQAIGTWNATSLGEGITLERGWTCHNSGVAQWEQRRAGVGLLAAQLSCHVLEVAPVNERVVSLRLWVREGSGLGFASTGQTAAQSTRIFLESLGGVLNSTPAGDPNLNLNPD